MNQSLTPWMVTKKEGVYDLAVLVEIVVAYRSPEGDDEINGSESSRDAKSRMNEFRL